MRLTPLLSAIVLLTACQSATDDKPVVKGDSATYYPYQAIYTESYGPGKNRQAALVLRYWKEWESGDVRKLDSLFADTVALNLPDLVFRGSSNRALALLNERRRRYADVQLFTDSWLPALANDPKEDLVFLWGRQDCTKPNGQRDYNVVHEVWRFDRSGKIRALDQYLTHPH